MARSEESKFPLSSLLHIYFLWMMWSCLILELLRNGWLLKLYWTFFVRHLECKSIWSNHASCIMIWMLIFCTGSLGSSPIDLSTLIKVLSIWATLLSHLGILLRIGIGSLLNLKIEFNIGAIIFYPLVADLFWLNQCSLVYQSTRWHWFRPLSPFSINLEAWSSHFYGVLLQRTRNSILLIGIL